MNQSIQPAKSDNARLSELIRQRAPKRRASTLLEFAPTCTITTGRTRGQKVSLEKAPYSKRVFELMDPGHACQLLTLMWSSQAMKSVSAQVVTCYYMIEDPREILYVSASDKSVRKIMDRRLSKMAQHLGIEFISSTITKGNKKTGDTNHAKEFPGGNLDACTANSGADLASETKGLTIFDEMQLYGDGNYEKQNKIYYDGYNRLKVYKEEKKCLIPSTPGISGFCMVEYLFGWGTQEEWEVECPCGHRQTLEVKNKEGWGLDWLVKKGTIDPKTVVYVCKDCGKTWKESANPEVQQTGIWIPDQNHQPVDDVTFSLHLHSINSQFEEWINIAKAYEKGMEDKEARRNYYNHVAGLPYSEAGYRFEVTDVMRNNRGIYQRQTVPDGVLYIAIGGDVQEGSRLWEEYDDEGLEVEIEKAKKDGTIHDKKFPRIEIEVIGRGPSYRSWSIDYQIFHGKIDDPYSGAFEKFYQWCQKISDRNKSKGRKGLGFFREKDNMFFTVLKIFLDSGIKTTKVYAFCQRISIAHPVKGTDELEKKKKTATTVIKQSDSSKYQWSWVGTGRTTKLCRLVTRLYKDDFYGWLSVKRVKGEIQRAGFQDFPDDKAVYDPIYFGGLTAFEKLPDDSWDNKNRYGEPSSCRDYGNCALDVQLDEITESLRNDFIKKGGDKKKSEEIGHKEAILWLAKQMRVDPRFIQTQSKK